MGYALAAYALVGLALGAYGVRLARHRRRLEARRGGSRRQNRG
jgi:hypothetical protein